MRPVDPASISDVCKKRAAELGVDPVAYRRWERGEPVPEVRDAIDAEHYTAGEAVPFRQMNADDPHSSE